MIPTRHDFIRHRESILRYWTRARDNTTGGFHHSIGPDGSVRPTENRALLIQARLLYNYAEGMRAGLDFCADHADHLYRFITQRMRTDNGWYASIADGRLFGPEVLDTYDNLFVVIGMARYALASGRADVAEETWRLFRLIESVAVRGDLACCGVVGGQSRLVTRRTSPTAFSGNNNLHYLEALVCLHDAGIGEDILPRGRAIREFFLTYILDRTEMVVFDRFHDSYQCPWRSPGAYTSLAHGLEWFDFFRCLPGLALDHSIEQALLDMALRHGVLPNGLFQDSYYLLERKSAGSGRLWPQVEAVKAFNHATALFGELYREPCRRLAGYYFEHFVDSDGGVFWEVDPNGVVTDRTKGGYWKCDYHVIRMCVDAIRRPDGAFEPRGELLR